MKILHRILRRFRKHEVVHFIPRLPVCMELSDGDRAALYGWPNKTIEEVQND